MNRTVRKVAERLRKRNEFDDLLQIYEQDKGVVTLPARLAVNALAGFEHADTVTAELNVQHTRRVAAAQATQAPKGPPPGMPGDAARVLYPSRIKEELAEEEDSHLDRQITQWRRQASQIFRWEHLEVLLQHLSQEASVC